LLPAIAARYAGHVTRAASGGRLLAVVLALALSWPAAAGTRRLVSDGAWIREARGRVVLLRGVNYSGLEFGNFFGAAHPPAESDFAQMATWGVNVVRLPVAWSYLEPEPNRFDLDHLRTVVDPVVGFARRYGMVVVLELHQFQWSPCTGGNGAPAWSCDGKGYSRDVFGGWNAQHDFWNGALGPDGRPLLDHFLVVWRALAHHYRRDRVVAGFNMLNEPFDVQALATFEATSLYPAYRRWVAAVRGEGAPQILVLEPPVSRNIGLGAKPEPVGDANIVYAPHLYTETAGLPEVKYDGDRTKVDADYALAAAEAATQGAVLWVGEHGGNTNEAGGFRAATELAIRDALDEQDERLVGGAVWAYFPTDNTFSVVDVNGIEKGALVDRLARPYPQATAGTPQSLHFDPESRELTYVFAEDPARRIPDPTIVFVPFARHYPNGVDVETTPGDRAVIDVRRNRIVLRRDRSLALHTLTVRPR
jgi:endoglycosylceramidase